MKTKIMNKKTIKPTLKPLVEKVNQNILQTVKITTYFKLNKEQKLGMNLIIYKIIKNSVKHRIKLTENEIINFIEYLMLHNGYSGNYELAEALKYIYRNYNSINLLLKPKSTQALESE